MQSRIINPKELVKKNPILQTIDLGLCVDCKAVKKLCGLARCPLIDALDVYPDQNDYQKISGNTVFGPSPQVFVGSQGYPRVNAGPLTSILERPDLASRAANPEQWVDLDLKEIISLRYGMVRGKKNIYIRPDKYQERLYEQMQQLTMSIKPVDVESLFSTTPRLSSTFDIETQPMGPSGSLAKLDIASNPKIPKRVDYILGDELKAVDQINSLYDDGYNISYLQNILSAGLTGTKKDKKIVPTRWSITATDDMIGKELIRSLKDLPSINQIELREGNLLGNEYHVILMPGHWSFENFETWISGGIFTIGARDWNMSYCSEGFELKEYYKGRSSYASQAGGYYATRLAILEHLTQRSREAKVLVIREITPDYVVPVGVWQVREGVRKTMRTNPITFNSKSELINYLNDQLHVNTIQYTQRATSFLQSSLDEFF